MINDIRVYPDDDGWHLAIEGDLIPDAADLVPILDGTLDVRVDPQLLDDALAPWRDHQAEGDSVRTERIAAGRVSWSAAHDVDRDGETARAIADELRDQARRK